MKSTPRYKSNGNPFHSRNSVPRSILSRVGILLCTGLVFLLFRCETPTDPTLAVEGDIPGMEITLSEQSLSRIGKSTQVNHWVPVEINIRDHESRARMRVHGNATRKLAKKSFQCEYLFTTKENPANSGFILSSQFLDPSFIRYTLATHFFKKAGLMISETRLVRLYLNGVYQGLYLRIERVDKRFLERRGLPPASMYEANVHSYLSYKNGALPQNGFDKQLPDDDQCYTDLAKLLHTIDIATESGSFDTLEPILDMDNVLRYYAASRIIRHSDGGRNNFRLYYNPHIDKFQFIPWDFDHTFEAILPEFPAIPNGLFEHLEKSPVYKKKLAEITRVVFDYPEATDVLYSQFARVAPYCDLEPWKQTSLDSCRREVEFIHAYLERVEELVREGE